MKSIAYFRSIKTVLLGMMVSQAIPLVGSLVIARIFTPADFGLFAAWLGLVTTIAVILTGRFEMVLVTEGDGYPRTNAMFITLATIPLIACLLVPVAIAAYFFIPFFQSFGISLIFIMVPASILTAMAQCWQALAAADGGYRNLSILRVSQSAGVVGAQIFLGLIFSSAISLAWGYLIGVLGCVLTAIYLMPINLGRPFQKIEFLQRVRSFWRLHHRFPMLALPADFINNLAAQLPVLIVASRFGPEFGGVLALTLKVVGAPIGLIGASVLDVFKRHAASSFRDLGDCRPEYIRNFKILSFFSVILGAGILIFSKPIFQLAYGDKWSEAGIIAIWLLPLFVMRFIASPLSYIFYISGKQHIDLVWQISLLAMTASAFFSPSDFETSVRLYGIGYGILYAIYLALSFKYSKRHQ